MITFTKALIGVGALGVTGLSAWGAYHISLPKTIQDKLSRTGLKILNLDVSKNDHETEWKANITQYQTKTASDATLKIKDLEITNSNEEGKIKQDIDNFKKKCSELLATSLQDAEIGGKEKQAKEWCFIKIKND